VNGDEAGDGGHGPGQNVDQEERADAPVSASEESRKQERAEEVEIDAEGKVDQRIDDSFYIDRVVEEFEVFDGSVAEINAVTSYPTPAAGSGA
jgi:hypothetical protein